MSSHRQSQPQQAGVVVRGGADRFGTLVVRAGKNFVKSHPKISITWVVGLLISILASGFTPSQEAVQKYEVCWMVSARGGWLEQTLSKL